jgi:hypothetical protein
LLEGVLPVSRTLQLLLRSRVREGVSDSCAFLVLLLALAVPRAGADPRFPDMEHWAQAGVRGGIPSIAAVERVAPGVDLQVAVDRAHAAGGGAVVLEAGDHELGTTLHLRSGVVVRGDRSGPVRIHLRLCGGFAAEQGGDGYAEWVAAISGRSVRRAGLEDLTLVFDDRLPAPPTLRTHAEAFVNDPGGRDDLWVVGVRFTASEDCWIDRCRIINSGTHPVLIEASRHVTVRDTEIEGAHNKGGRGAGYFNITRSEYTLLEKVRVRDLRHVAIQNADARHPCRYTVVLDSHFEVDLNFHNGDSGHHLVQDTTIAVPPWHWWHPVDVGVPGQHAPPGPGTLVFRCRIARAYPDPKRNYTLADDPKVVYRLRDSFDRARPILEPAGPAPAGGTLYRR